MKTNTEKDILAYIKQKKQVSAKEIVAFSGYSPQAVFRHLKALQANNEIYKVGKPPMVRYYVYANTMENQITLITDATNWAISGDERFIRPEYFCQTRDVFQARTDRLIGSLKKLTHNENLSFLLAAVVGEVGNNSFDHNIGRWLGVPGVLFAVDEPARVIIVADRGQGVFTTLKRVRPELTNDMEALKMAFTKKVSGRSPEQRGNGLKFVKKIVMENNLHLSFYSGDALSTISSQGMNITNSNTAIPGTLCLIKF